MTTSGPSENNQPAESPQRSPHQGVPFGAPAVLTDSLLRQSARFSAMIGVLLYGLAGGGALLSPSRSTGPEALVPVVCFLGVAAALGFGVHHSRRAGDTLPVLATGLLVIVLLGVYWVLGVAPPFYLDLLELYAVFVTPVLGAVALAALAWLTERAQGPPTRQVSSIPADPYPWVSTVFAVALYGVVFLYAVVMYFLLAGGLNFDQVPEEPAPTNVLLGTLALCLPLPLLLIGLSASLSGRVRSTAPIFVTAGLAGLAVLLSVPQVLVDFTDAWPLRWALALLLAAPLVWPILRSWQGIPAHRRCSWSGL
ncbi:hypothetical protein [Nocardiopsis valliformis]|uniref:hypothetical protein n=1 Tax=Nocardiopsis valliformis TaxID=239974 RepID=UPI00034899F9|nr:hypothetical protein [Nocardiopsis valliformis]